MKIHFSGWCVANCIQENFEYTKTSANLNDDEYGQDFR